MVPPIDQTTANAKHESTKTRWSLSDIWKVLLLPSSVGAVGSFCLAGPSSSKALEASVDVVLSSAEAFQSYSDDPGVPR